MKDLKFTLKKHEHKGKEMTDLIVELKGHKFTLVPLNKSKKAKSYFYALLTDCERS